MSEWDDRFNAQLAKYRKGSAEAVAFITGCLIRMDYEAEQLRKAAPGPEFKP